MVLHQARLLEGKWTVLRGRRTTLGWGRRPRIVSQMVALLKQGIERSCEAAGVVNSWEGCLLKEEVPRFEADLIKRALEAANGHITPAARLLGLSHQALAAILQGRHKLLLSARTPVRKRRRSIIRTSLRKRF